MEVVTYVSPTNVFFTLSIAAVESLEQKSSSQLKPNKNMGLGGACLGQNTNHFAAHIRYSIIQRKLKSECIVL